MTSNSRGTDCSICRSNEKLLSETGTAKPSPGRETASSAKRKLNTRLVMICISALLFAAGLFVKNGSLAYHSQYLEYVIFFTAFFLTGGRIIWKALYNLVRGRVFDEYFLMSIAASGAIAIGELPEAVAVMLFFNTGEFFEEKAVDRSHRAIAALMEIRPHYANLLGPDETTRRVDPDSVRPGQEILVRPGERIPLDGEVLSGESYVNSVALTGESVPGRVEPGAAVLAGAVNESGLLRVKVTHGFEETSLARIFRLIREAASRKAKTEQFITTFARYYTPAVVIGALLLAVLPPLLFAGASFSDWLYRALVLLVISCPCALVISIPLGYFGGIGCASRNGILIKGSNFLEALLKVKTVVFDKTGTLTSGSVRVLEVLPGDGFSAPEILSLAAHAGFHSSHPVSRSFREALTEELSPERVGGFEEFRGLGIKALVDGRAVLAGSSRLMKREKVSYPAAGSNPGNIVYLAVDNRLAGRLIVGDELKEDAAEAVGRLKKLGVWRTVMLTGDVESAAAPIASRVGVDSFYAGLLPHEKVEKVEELLAEAASRGGKLAFVGDGINDAPALSRADVGIAMGGIGSDAAVEAADVVIMDDRPVKVARAVQIASFTRKIVTQNIVLALGVKGIFMAMGAFGAITIWGAVFADVGVALLAIINATRVLRYKPAGPPIARNLLVPAAGIRNKQKSIL